MGDVTLGVELSGGTARGVALEERKGGWRLRWRGAVSGGGGRRELAERLLEELEASEVEPTGVAIALPPSPGTVYQTLQLPPLEGRELATVAGSELRREVGEDSVQGLEVRAWQFGAGRGDNTLAVGVPSEVLEGALAFGRGLGCPLLGITLPPLALHHGLLGMDALPPDRTVGIAYVGDQFGFVAYVREGTWVLIHHFPVPGDEPDTDGIVRETKQSFTFLRSRAPDAKLDRVILCGPGLPTDDLPARLEEELSDVGVREFSFPGSLDLEGLPHAADFVRRQGRDAVPLLLAARPRAAPVDYVPVSERLPRLRRRFLRRAASAVGAGLLLVAAHAGLAWSSGSDALDRAQRLEAQLSELGPRLERLEEERLRERSAVAALHLADVASQQATLGPAALRRLSTSVSEGVTVDSLALTLDGDGWIMRVDGRATGTRASEPRRRLNELLSGLQGATTFLDVRVSSQEMSRLPDGTFLLRFRVAGTLLDGRAAGG